MYLKFCIHIIYHIYTYTSIHMHLHIHMHIMYTDILHISSVHVILEPLGAIRCARRGNGWKNRDDRRNSTGWGKVVKKFQALKRCIPGNSAIVTFLGWLSDPFQWLSDLQLGDEKVTLNHQVHFLSGDFNQ